MATLLEMEARLEALADAIRETEARLPVHSVKPPVMKDLFALEDEYERLAKQIRDCKERSCEVPEGEAGNRPGQIHEPS